MKRIIYTLFLSLILLIGKSQDYKPFDLKNGEWFCKYFTKGGMPYGEQGDIYVTDSIKFFCSGDTVISKILFKKLYYEGYASSQVINRKYISGYFGAIRNDTVNKKVWINDFLMYDFNLKVGDSICRLDCFYLPFCFSLCGRVISIDSIKYCNKYFKKYNIINDQNRIRAIIEGIGSDDGLFPVYSSPWYSDLICYSEKNNADCPSCNMEFTDFEKYVIDKIDVNSFSMGDQLHISAKHLITSIELTDIAGRQIYKNYKENRNSIYINDIKNGIYILRIKINNQYIVIKVLKT